MQTPVPRQWPQERYDRRAPKRQVTQQSTFLPTL